MADDTIEGEKIPTDVAPLIRRSVQQEADGAGIPPGGGVDTAGSFLIYMAGQVADGVTPWGVLPKKRDRELRNFWPTENYLAGALATVAARNAAFGYKLVGAELSVETASNMLKNVEYGKGWSHWIVKESIDYLSQDAGCFVQIIRAGDSPFAPAIHLTHLDAWRVFPTGKPDIPYLYLDRRGKYHEMKWYQIANIMEMPAPVEHPQGGPLYELQVCAVSRVLRAAQILRNIAIYKDEKVSGRFLKAIHLLSGVSRQEVQDAIHEQRLAADNAGQLRYMNPLMISSIDPKVPVNATTLELASMPDGYDEEKTMRSYYTALALGFLTDVQEFAPLPSGNLGSGAQSETLHMKSRGKGPALFKARFAHFINTMVLPSNVTFEWDEQDTAEDKAQADAAKVRADTRGVQVATGELDALGARAIAVEMGDIPAELIADLESRDAERIAQEEQQRQDEIARLQSVAAPAGGPKTNEPGVSTSDEKAFPPSRKRMEDAAQRKLEDELDDVFEDVAKRIEQIVAVDSGDRAWYKPAKKPKRTKERTTIERGADSRISATVTERLEVG